MPTTSQYLFVLGFRTLSGLRRWLFKIQVLMYFTTRKIRKSHDLGINYLTRMRLYMLLIYVGPVTDSVSNVSGVVFDLGYMHLGK
jgi:hypothetical protein